MDEAGDTSARPRWSRLSPDALSIVIAVLTVGAALAALILTTTADIRAEARADRAAWQAESRQLRDEARADREAARTARDAAQAARDADRESFQREIIRLTAEQAEPPAIVKQ